MSGFVAVTEDGFLTLVEERNFSRSISHSIYSGDGAVMQYDKVWAVTEAHQMVEVKPIAQNAYPVEDKEGYITHRVTYYWMGDSNGKFYGEPFTVSVNMLV